MGISVSIVCLLYVLDVSLFITCQILPSITIGDGGNNQTWEKSEKAVIFSNKC